MSAGSSSVRISVVPPDGPDLHSSDEHASVEPHQQRLNGGAPLRAPSRRAYVPRPDGHACAKYRQGPPESVGKIVLLSSGRLGVLSPREESGRRRILGAHDTYADANERLQRWRLARAVSDFFDGLIALARSESST